MIVYDWILGPLFALKYFNFVSNIFNSIGDQKKAAIVIGN